MSKELRDEILPKFLEDDTYLFATAVSEARGLAEVWLGYEPGGFDTYAVRKGNEYIINGTKAYCSGGPIAKAIQVLLRTDRKGPLTKSSSMFHIPVNTPGLVIGKVHDSLGVRTLLTCELAFEDMRVPASYLIGEEDQCFVILGGETPKVMAIKACHVLGILRALYEEAVNYARTRVVCGKPIIQHDTIKVMLADMRMKVDAARGLIWKVAWDIDHHPERIKENAENGFLCLAFVKDIILAIVKHADEVHGGMGTNKEVLTEKLIRDAITWLHAGHDETVLLMVGAPTLEG